MLDDFSKKSESFRIWFQNKRTNLNPKIQLADLRNQNAGRGVVALADIEADEELFSVSRHDILSAETSDFAKHDAGRALIAELEDQWVTLILVMIFEYLRGEQSPWKEYLDVLPTTFNTLMFWTEQELEYLQASAVRGKIGKQSANDMFREKVVKPVRANNALFPDAASASDDDILALAHRMGSTIMAYAFDIEREPSTQDPDEEGYVSEDEDEMLPKGMVPMADMLNADADKNNARLFYGESMVTMKALTPIKAGEEIFNDYGPLPRADLLRRYGYLTNNYAQYDVAEIPIETVVRNLAADEAEPALVDKKLAYLEDEDVFEDGYDIARPLEGESLFPTNLRLLLAILDVPEVQLKNLSGTQTLKKRLLEKTALLLYSKVLQDRLSEYATTAEEDRQLLSQTMQPPSSIHETRILMAVQVRLGEKDILIEASQKLRELIAQAHQAPSQKRQATDDVDSATKRRRG